jgi:threonine dehydratase
MSRSLEAGERVAVEPGPTLADGLKPVMVGALNFALARRRVRAGLRVDDDELGRAVALLAIRAKLVVEPSGAAGVAAAMRHLPGRIAEEDMPEDVGVILTGGNLEPELLVELISRHAEWA